VSGAEEYNLPEWRNLVCGAIMLSMPALLPGQSTDRALLHGDGGTLRNGAPATSSAIFPDDVIQTQRGDSATLDAEGSSARLLGETIVQFEADELVLDHGQVEVSTARGLRVRVGCLTVIPLTAERTQFEVMDVDGKVKVIANLRDVKIHDRGAEAKKSRQSESSDGIVREGHRTTREEKCGVAARPEEVIDARGAILNGVPARIAGGAAIIAIACAVLCHPTDDPVSPSNPR
jgi:hypothetical protein